MPRAKGRRGGGQDLRPPADYDWWADGRVEWPAEDYEPSAGDGEGDLTRSFQKPGGSGSMGNIDKKVKENARRRDERWRSLGL